MGKKETTKNYKVRRRVKRNKQLTHVDVSINPIIDKLYEMFTQLNDRFFGGSLLRPVITIQTSTRKVECYGWFTPYEAWKRGENDHAELNIVAEILHKTFLEICTILMHEMTHYYCYRNEIKDTSRGGAYHNKLFRKYAEASGLICKKTEKYGHGITILSEGAEKWINDNMDGSWYDLYRIQKTKNTKTNKNIKYQCPICKASCWVTKKVSFACKLCGVDLERK